MVFELYQALRWWLRPKRVGLTSDTHVIEGHTCSSCSGRLRLMRLRVPAPCLYVKQRTNKSRQLPYEKGGGVAPGWFVVRIDFL